MALFIGQTLIKDVSAISELTRQAIAFIDGGSEWVRWALHGPEIRAQFADESQMVGAIQSGLHGSPFAYLPHLQLMVSPVKLMTLSLDELQIIARAEIDPTHHRKNEQLDAILARHGLLTNDQLKHGTDWLRTLHLPQLDLFQVTTFDEQLALADLARSVRERDIDPTLCADAASFAITESRTALEFTDFFRCYLGVAEKLPAKAKPAETVRDAAQSVVQLLSPLAFHALDCPQTAPLSRPDEVTLAVELWAASGRALGFARVSACVREIVLHTRLVGDQEWFKHREAWARDRFEAYVETVRALTLRAKVRHPFMGQDGATCHYSMEAGDYVARVQLDPAGVITLSSLQKSSASHKVINLFEPNYPPPTEEGR
jgi:hypothetical protein